MMTEEKVWYSEWFDSKYYHLLYQERDHSEAAKFLDKLLDAIDVQPRSKVLDLACGRGRHSIYLSTKDLLVTGIDLSPKNIAVAAEEENERLHFAVHDMREPYNENYFDYVFNLFTSFGYFDSDAENVMVLKAARANLRSRGIFVLDFMNVEKVLGELVHDETKTVGEIDFNIRRRIENGFIVKDISFEDVGVEHHYQERVKAIDHDMFMEYFAQTKFELLRTYGSYDLKAFDKNMSDRLIFILRNQE